jgi:hypothetical protein
MNASLRQYDVVRVVRLNSSTRDFIGTEGVRRAPRIGDEGTICDQYDPDDPRAPVIVEMVDGEGMTVWFADFVPDELELLRRP